MNVDHHSSVAKSLFIYLSTALSFQKHIQLLSLHHRAKTQCTQKNIRRRLTRCSHWPICRHEYQIDMSPTKISVGDVSDQPVGVNCCGFLSEAVTPTDMPTDVFCRPTCCGQKFLSGWHIGLKLLPTNQQVWTTHALHHSSPWLIDCWMLIYAMTQTVFTGLLTQTCKQNCTSHWNAWIFF